MSERTRANWFDMLVYRLFYWRWRQLLIDNPELLEMFRKWVNGYMRECEIHRKLGQLESERR